MNMVLARLVHPIWLLVGLAAIVLLIAALALLVVDGLPDTQQFVAPFRWVPSEPSA